VDVSDALVCEPLWNETGMISNEVAGNAPVVFDL
jgi:hypothetical protein